jgi:hypothetical protein
MWVVVAVCSDSVGESGGVIGIGLEGGRGGVCCGRGEVGGSGREGGCGGMWWHCLWKWQCGWLWAVNSKVVTRVFH